MENAAIRVVERTDPQIEAILGALVAFALIILTYLIWRQCQKKSKNTISTVDTSPQDHSLTSRITNSRSVSLPTQNTSSGASLPTQVPDYSNLPYYGTAIELDVLGKSKVSYPGVDTSEVSVVYPDSDTAVPSAPPPPMPATAPEYPLTGVTHHLPPLPDPVYPPPAYEPAAVLEKC